MSIEQRLKDLDITLPSPPVPVACYAPYTIAGKLVHIAGQLPLAEGSLRCKGRLDGNITIEDGQAAARCCAINVVAQLKAACGAGSRRMPAGATNKSRQGSPGSVVINNSGRPLCAFTYGGDPKAMREPWKMISASLTAQETRTTKQINLHEARPQGRAA